MVVVPPIGSETHSEILDPVPTQLKYPILVSAFDIAIN